MKARIDTVLLFAVTLWCAAILVAPALSMEPVYAFFSLICHQNPERSWYLLDRQLPVCIRCASIYFGFLLALALHHRPNAVWLKIAIGLTILEFGFEVFAMDSAIARSVTGILLGAAAAPFVRVGIEEMLGGERSAV